VDARETGTILDRIVAKKRDRLRATKDRCPLSVQIRNARAASPARDFKAAIGGTGRILLIAEIKKASPSKGMLAESLNVTQLAQSYERAGASAISVITEEDFFQGAQDYLRAARRVVSLPLLRKDFIFDSYQIYESRALGADAVLLIVAILNDRQLSDLQALCRVVGIAALVEVHDEDELSRAIACGSDIIGINSRNLKTMEVDLSTLERLAGLVPDDKVIVAESGIRNAEDLRRLRSLGISAVLMGEAIVTAPDPEARIRSLLGEDS
jgi:indole-3-glycerol phosphate synthase